MLFSGSYDTKIICWNEVDGQLIRTYNGHTGPVNALYVFDSSLYSAGQERIVLRWHIENGNIETVFPEHHDQTIWCFAFEPDSLYSGSIDTTVIRWDLNSSSRQFTYFGRNIKLRSLVLWKYFVVTGGDNLVIRIQDKSTTSVSPIEIISGHSTGIGCMIVQNDTLFSGSGDSTIRRRSLINFEQVKVYFGHQNSVVALSLDEKFLYSGSYDFTMKRWNISSGVFDREFIGHVGYVMSIQNQESFLYSGSFDSTVKVWDSERAIIKNSFNYPTSVLALYIYDNVLIVGSKGLDMISLSTGEVLAFQEESSNCFSVEATNFRIYSGHDDGLVRGRDPSTLNILENFQGHKDIVMSLCLDDTNVLFSTGFDGSVKRWNMASRKVSFSFENRNGSVTALTVVSGIIFVGTREGIINSFNIGNAYVIESQSYHRSIVTSLVHTDRIMYSSGMDGVVFEHHLTNLKNPVEAFDTGSIPVTAMTLNKFKLVAVKDEIEILVFPAMNFSGIARSLYSPLPINSITASKEIIFAASKSGSILAWNAISLETMFILEYHTSQVNSLLVAESTLYSASNDKTIIKWSLGQRVPTILFQRLSSTALGHLGPVNSICLCGNTLFSVSSDLTTRRWNTKTGRHEDVYFGATKSVTAVACYNRSVFSGSEDFSVLMYSPTLPEGFEIQTLVSTSTSNRRVLRTKTLFELVYSRSETFRTALLVGGILATVILFAIAVIAYFYSSWNRKKERISKREINIEETRAVITDLETVVNTVVGISKHASYVIENSCLATMKKLASGGGGEVFLARVMNSFLKEKTGTLVIQKLVFIKNSKSEEAFYQEVGIMIMLSPFQNFCRIIGYTVNPASIILQYYPDGSLNDWIRSRKSGNDIIVKVSKEISSALKMMHSYYLAHCDLKPQNVLVEIKEGTPTCYLTDFGITQVLSERILAARALNVITLKGLSVYYAAPEAFSWFRTKVFTGVDFKNFDIYSFSCVVFELLTKKTPWS